MGSINRKPHVLRPEKTLAIPRHVIFTDTETNQFVSPEGDITHTLKLGWACYYRRSEPRRRERSEWLNFTTPDEFWSFVSDNCRTKNRLWVIAHNLSFDFTVLEGFRFLHRDGYKCKFFYSKGITTLIKVTKRGSSIVFVDSLNWFKESLEKIGDRIGIPKLKIEFETASFSQLNTYCKRDVEILIGIFKHLCRFLEANKISRLCYTIGSTAMAAYLFRHYRKPIYIHNNAEAIDLERDSYKGGRTECFYIGELSYGPYYVVDVNSLYPYVMHKHFYPVKYDKIVWQIECSDLQRILSDRCVVATVLIETDKPVYAVKTDRTIFPTGSFTVTLTTPELIFAFDHGHIKRVDAAVIYERASIFTTYVDRFYQLRQEFIRADNPLFDHFCKILMNSLYGKFGQKAEVWQKIGNCHDEPDRVEDVIDAVTHRRKQIRYLLGEISELVGHEESRHSFPAIASHVTAYARLYLWSLMEKAGHRNYFYCDTDSLFVNQTGLNNLTDLIDDNVLGSLKVESVTDRLTIYGLKDYVINTKTVIKGIRKSAVRVSDTTYRQDSWPSLKGILRSGKTGIYTTHRIEKHLSRDYTKGKITPVGWTVPFRFDEIPLL